MKKEIGDKVLVYAVIAEIKETIDGMFYQVIPDSEKYHSFGMTAPEDCVKTTDEILEQVKEKC